MKREEDRLQTAVAEWLDIQQRLGRLLWFHVPNTARRTPREGARFKRLGVKAGVPDIALVLPGGRAAFIELKSARGKMTTAQLNFAGGLSWFNALHAVCRSLDDVMVAVESWRRLVHLGPSPS